jgi:hypothetical protein
VLVLLFIIMLMGALAYRATPKESFPEIAIPMIAINTMYAGVSPADVESQITRIIEEDLSTISEIKELTSTSVEGYSSILAEFDVSVNLDEALQKTCGCMSPRSDGPRTPRTSAGVASGAAVTSTGAVARPPLRSAISVLPSVRL